VDAAFMLLERAAAQRTLIIDWAAVQALTTFLVRMRYRCILVTADTRPNASRPRIDTTWMPSSCSSSDMAAASMSYALVPMVSE
jgi:hypothetical protein